MNYAGFWKRFAAAIIDLIITMIGGFALGFVSGMVMIAARIKDPALLQGINFIIGILLVWIYFAMMESSPRQGTLGKMALGIKVTDTAGETIGFGRATSRHFGRYLSSILLGIGYIMVAFTPKKQGLHDMMAGCLVVNK